MQAQVAPALACPCRCSRPAAAGGACSGAGAASGAANGGASGGASGAAPSAPSTGEPVAGEQRRLVCCMKMPCPHGAHDSRSRPVQMLAEVSQNGDKPKSMDQEAQQQQHLPGGFAPPPRPPVRAVPVAATLCRSATGSAANGAGGSGESVMAAPAGMAPAATASSAGSVIAQNVPQSPAWPLGQSPAWSEVAHFLQHNSPRCATCRGASCVTRHRTPPPDARGLLAQLFIVAFHVLHAAQFARSPSGVPHASALALCRVGRGTHASVLPTCAARVSEGGRHSGLADRFAEPPRGPFARLRCHAWPTPRSSLPVQVVERAPTPGWFCLAGGLSSSSATALSSTNGAAGANANGPVFSQFKRRQQTSLPSNLKV